MPATPRSSPDHTVEPPVTSNPELPWALQYELQFAKFTKSITENLTNGKRLSRSERLLFVRIVVASIMETNPNPTKDICRVIVRGIVQHYRLSLQDRTLTGERLGCGYRSLLEQITNRVQNVNRNNTLTRLRRLRSFASEGSTAAEHSTNLKRVPDSYGCVMWQPEMPENEDDSSMEEKRQRLLLILDEHGPNHTGDSLKELMASTYSFQSLNINQNPPLEIKEIADLWPFLSVPRWILHHFAILVGFDPSARLKETLQTKGNMIKNYFMTACDNKQVKATVRRFVTCPKDLSEEAGLLLMIMAYFGEEEEVFFITADVGFFC